MDPYFRLVSDFHPGEQRDNDVSHDEDREIGRRVVCAVMMEFLTAMVAIVSDFQKLAEEFPFTACRTFEEQATFDGLPGWACVADKACA